MIFPKINFTKHDAVNDNNSLFKNKVSLALTAIIFQKQ